MVTQGVFGDPDFHPTAALFGCLKALDGLITFHGEYPEEMQEKLRDKCHEMIDESFDNAPLRIEEYESKA